MAGPKRYIKNVNITKPKVGVDRRVEMFDNINENQGFLPRGVDYEDMDSEFIKFVENDLEIVIDGQKVPVIMLSIQRWAEFSKTWEKSDEFKDIKIPFITIVRNPAPEPGTNQAGLWNIAGERVWDYRKIPSFDGVRQGVDIYKIPQPTSVDLTYNVRLFANKMRDVNKMNHIIHKLFVKRQFYIYPNEHPMPVILESNNDESELGDFENRRYYVQNYELKLLGYTLDENDFKKIPAINRNLIVSEISDSDTSLNDKLKEVKFPKAKNKVGVYNSTNKLLSSVFCGENYTVSDSNITNSGGTYNVNLPATDNLLLPNITVDVKDLSGNTIFSDVFPSATDVEFTFNCLGVNIENSDGSYNVLVASGNDLTLPDTVVDILDSTGTFINQVNLPSSVNGNVIAPDSNYVLRNTENTFLLSGNTVSGGLSNIIAPDGIVNINGIYVDNVSSSGVTNISVQQSGVEVGSLSGGGTNIWVIPECPSQPEKVYLRPTSTQKYGLLTGDEYYQRNNLGLWEQKPGRVMVIDPNDFTMLADLSGQGIDNTNPLGDYRRFTSTNNQDFDFSNNTPSDNGRGFYICICDWLTGTMWLLTVMEENSDGSFVNIVNNINTPYNGPIPHDGSPSGTYTPNYFKNTVNNALNTSNKLLYGFDDWQIPTFAHFSQIYNYNNGIQEAIFNNTNSNSASNLDSTLRGLSSGNPNHHLWRFDGVGTPKTVINYSSSRFLLVREIDESDFPLNP